MRYVHKLNSRMFYAAELGVILFRAPPAHPCRMCASAASILNLVLNLVNIREDCDATACLHTCTVFLAMRKAIFH